jgi:P2 family phage major capsid protein
MKKQTRILYAALQVGMATAYGVSSMASHFVIDEPQQTELTDAVRESSEFLSRITMIGVTDTKGQALEIGVDGMIGRRTDTDLKDREGNELGSPTGSKWETAETDFDVFIKYRTLDVWARFKDFHQRYLAATYKAIALTRMSIGFHGVSVAVGDSDPVLNPLGQDLNKGWFQILKEQNPGNYLDTQDFYLHADATEAQGYKSLDGLVADLFNSIPLEHRTGQEVAIIGSDLLAADSNKVYNDHGNTPSEKKDILTMLNSYGGLKAVQVPKFPTMGVMVTDLENLHLYTQETSAQRSQVDEPKRKRVADYYCANDAYAIGDVKAIAAIDPAKLFLVLPAAV